MIKTRFPRIDSGVLYSEEWIIYGKVELTMSLLLPSLSDESVVYLSLEILHARVARHIGKEIATRANGHMIKSLKSLWCLICRHVWARINSRVWVKAIIKWKKENIDSNQPEDVVVIVNFPSLSSVTASTRVLKWMCWRSSKWSVNCSRYSQYSSKQELASHSHSDISQTFLSHKPSVPAVHMVATSSRPSLKLEKETAMLEVVSSVPS